MSASVSKNAQGETGLYARLACIAIPVMGLLGGCAASQPSPVQRPSAAEALNERIDSLVEAARVELELPGVSIVLLQGDSVLLGRGYGFADVENGVPATEHTVYGIGSLSKQFAAAAVMRLVEQRRIGLDDPVRTHLPEFLQTGTEITVRHLLRQTSGLADFGSFPEIVAIRGRAEVEPAQFDLARGIRLVSQASRQYEPGEWWSYSGSNYLLLTAIVERVTGESFHEFVSEMLEPLGLRVTHVCGLPDRGARAAGYQVEDGSFTVRPLARNTADAGSGGLCSSAMDIASWKRALVGGRAVTRSSFQQMIAAEPISAGFAPPYGFGLSLVPVAGRPAIWHTGVISGHTSVLAYLPEDDLTVAMITNRRRADVTALFMRVVRAALNLPDPVLEDLPVSAERIAQVTGTYDDYLFTISVFEDAGRLQAHISDMDLAVPLLFQGGNEFATAEPDAFRFRFESAGERAERVVFEWDEIRSYGRRVRAEPEAAPDGSWTEGYPTPHGYAQTPASCERWGCGRAGHGGSWLGFNNMLMRYPDQQFTVVLLSNIEQFDREILASRIARRYLEEQMRFPDEIAVDSTALPAYVGSYRLGGEAGFVVTLRDDVLWLHAPNGSEHRLVPIALDTFVFHELEDVTITFERDAAGQVRSLRRHQYSTQYAERLH